MDALLAAVPHDGALLSPIVDYASPFEAIKAHSAGVDLVVMGTHGRTGIDRIFLGSVAEKVVRSVDRPVITVHRESQATFPPKSILVGVDFSAGAKAAFSAAAEIANRFGAELRLLHVIAGIPVLEGAEVLVIASAEGAPTPYYQLARDRAAQEMEQFIGGELDLGRPGFVSVEIGDPSHVIVEKANELGVDLIALGTRGRGHFSRFAMGSVAERVVRTSPVPVLTLHHP
jgi:nucleotide-binding universal stress UspA family protein